MRATKRTIIWALFLLQLLFAGLVIRHFWPRAVEIEDVALIRLLPCSYGDMHFTSATILQLTDGYYEFGDLSAPNLDYALIYTGSVRTNVNVNARLVNVKTAAVVVGGGPLITYNAPPSSPWWKKAMAKLPLL